MRTIWLKILFFGRSGLSSSVFEKLLVSYSCISFMKYHALRSFCINLLCFSKFWFFQIFDRSNLLLDRSKLRLKFWFVSAWLDQCLIDAGSIECNFRSIECNFRSIEYVFRSIEYVFWLIKNRSESFLNHEIFTCSSIFKFFQKALSLSLWPIQIQSQFFVVFSQIFLKVFVV